MKIHKTTYKGANFEHWYDRSTQCWWLARFDTEGNQIGDAQHEFTKDGIVSMIPYLYDLTTEASA